MVFVDDEVEEEEREEVGEGEEEEERKSELRPRGMSVAFDFVARVLPG